VVEFLQHNSALESTSLGGGRTQVNHVLRYFFPDKAAIVVLDLKGFRNNDVFIPHTTSISSLVGKNVLVVEKLGSSIISIRNLNSCIIELNQITQNLS